MQRAYTLHVEDSAGLEDLSEDVFSPATRSARAETKHKIRHERTVLVYVCIAKHVHVSTMRYTPSYVCFIQVLKVRLSLKKAYIGAGLKHVLATKQGFTKALHELLLYLTREKETTKNNITRQSRLVPALIFQVQ